jgi:hypothetical protein
MLSIEQSASTIASGYWKWSVWLKGMDQELDQVTEVRYQLHPTFSPPIQIITDRQSKFRLDSSGWGEFAIYATVSRRAGPPERLQHWLKLGERAPVKDDPQGGTVRHAASRPRVFLSHSAADSTFASELHVALQERGIEVARVETLTASPRSAADAVKEVIEEVPVGVVVVSKQSSPWVEQETKTLLDNNTFVIPILLSQGPSSLDKLVEGLQSVQLQEGMPLSESVKQVADQTAVILRGQGFL